MCFFLVSVSLVINKVVSLRQHKIWSIICAFVYNDNGVLSLFFVLVYFVSKLVLLSREGSTMLECSVAILWAHGREPLKAHKKSFTVPYVTAP